MRKALGQLLQLALRRHTRVPLQDLRALQLLAEAEGFEKTAEWLEGEIGYKISFTDYPRSTKDFYELREAVNRRICDII